MNTENIIAKYVSYVTNGALAIMGALTLPQIALIVGMVLGLLTYLTSFFFLYRKDKRDKKLYEIEMAAKGQIGIDE